MAFVYLLRCSDGSLYCGWTTDLERRLAAHNRGHASRYTASRRPVAYAATWTAESRSDAMRREAAIKRLTRGEKLRLVAAARRPPDDRLDPASAGDRAAGEQPGRPGRVTA